ncbi:DMT family transporter [Roseovarius spongiae]|uniref:DMT family transporter n=1 Tax=Roseovarius spongiae TaxID=2320272 RepID=A0A3A8B3I9_9RHOB|nr:DMT family transporter [Roseovarius spongiae]RKF15402.1 DMT family transporter [Roseovarius spongiae]
MTRSENLTGALLMAGSVMAFATSDTFLKLIAGELPIYEILFLRGVLTSIALLVIAQRAGVLRRAVPRADKWRIALRCLAEIGASYFFFNALFRMPLANVIAILQVAPLSITLAAALVYREPLGWRRLTAIMAGFAGVMLIVRPGAEGFTVYSLYALASVGCVTVRDLCTRRLGRDVPSVLVSLVTSVVIMTFFGLASLGEEWVTPTARQTGLIAAAALFVVGGYLSAIMVMRVGEIAFVSPFRYASLIWALLLGWAVFGDWPLPLTLLGAGIVVGSGVFTLYREARLGLVKKPGVPPLHPR